MRRADAQARDRDDAVNVVHLVSPEFVPAGRVFEWPPWDAPDGSTRHVAVAWRDAATTVSPDDIVVAHGKQALAALDELSIDVGPRLVYRPPRERGRRWRRRRAPDATWIAAPDADTAKVLREGGADADRVHVVETRDDWWALTNAIRSVLVDAETAPAERAAANGAPAGVVDDVPVSPVVPTEPPADRLGAPAAAPDDDDARPWPPDRDAGPSGDTGSPDTAPGRPALLPVGTVDPTLPGQAWWRYRRPDVPGAAAPDRDREDHRGPGRAAAGERGDDRRRAPVSGADGPAGEHRTSVATIARRTGAHAPSLPDEPPAVHTVPSGASGLVPFLIGAGLLAGVAIARQAGMTPPGSLLVPIGGVFLAFAAAQRIARVRPDESWVGSWLVMGVIVKIFASWYRHYTLITTYDGVGDATVYDEWGRKFAEHWLHGAANPDLPDLRQTNFIRWFTGVVYFVFGSNLLTGTLVFGLIAVIGSYLWYRATVNAVPFVDKRLYLGLVLFAPSIVFWPASVGKEALMQFGIGAAAFATSLLMRQRLLVGLLVGVGGGWSLWIVRPHILALVTIAAGAAYLAGRVRKQDGKGSLLGRPIGIIVIAFLVTFAITQGAEFLGIKSLSLKSIQDSLDQQTERSAQGGSQFDNGSNSLNPIYFPRNAVTVLLRPFPWETDSNMQLLASAESMALAAMMVIRFNSLRVAFARSRERPFLMYCWVLVGLYVTAFASFANFGLLVRQRSLVLPALLVLLAVDPSRVDDGRAVDVTARALRA
jgi:hypothetical protein